MKALPKIGAGLFFAALTLGLVALNPGSQNDSHKQTDNLARGLAAAAQDGLRPSGPGDIVARDYGVTGQAAFDAAKAGIGSAPRTLVLSPGVWEFTTDNSVPANITLKPERGAVLTRAGGAHLTINGGLDCGPYQCFSDNSANLDWVVFGKGAVRTAYPEWWGADPTGVADSATALQAAYNCAGQNTVGLSFAGSYRTTAEIVPAFDIIGVTLRGSGAGTSAGACYTSRIFYDGTSDSTKAVLRLAGKNFLRNRIEGLEFDGNDKAGWGVKFDSVVYAAAGWGKNNNYWVQDIFIRGRVHPLQIGDSTAGLDLNADDNIFDACDFVVPSTSAAIAAVLIDRKLNYCRFTFRNCQFAYYDSCPATLENWLIARAGEPLALQISYFSPISGYQSDSDAPKGYAINNQGANLVIQGGWTEGARLAYNWHATETKSDNDFVSITGVGVNDVRSANDLCSAVASVGTWRTTISDCHLATYDGVSHEYARRISGEWQLISNNCYLGAQGDFILARPGLCSLNGVTPGSALTIPNWDFSAWKDNSTLYDGMSAYASGGAVTMQLTTAQVIYGKNNAWFNVTGAATTKAAGLLYSLPDRDSSLFRNGATIVITGYAADLATYNKLALYINGATRLWGEADGNANGTYDSSTGRFIKVASIYGGTSPWQIIFGIIYGQTGGFYLDSFVIVPGLYDLAVARACFTSGVSRLHSLNGGSVHWGNAAPTGTGITWHAGDRIMGTAGTDYLCTADGAPGTWVSK